MKKLLIILMTFFSLAALQGQTWSAVGNGVNGSVRSFAIYNGELYIGGQFNISGSVSPIGLMKWNGVSFDTLPGNYLFGVYNIWSMAVYNNELYVGGAFDHGNHPHNSIYNYIARWNGVKWDSVSNGFDNLVYSLAVYNGNLYAGGDIQMTGSTYVGCIAKWDGNQWYPVANGIGGPGSRVTKLLEYKNELYAAGGFPFTSINSSCIARWNDTVWNTVGNGGINGYIYSLDLYNNDLYAGSGCFTLAGGTPVNDIAKWNGTTWASAGSGIGCNGGELNALKEYHNELYAGGWFNIMDGDSIKGIARYNGLVWNSVGSGVDSTNIIFDTIVGFPSLFDTAFIYAPHEIWAFQEFNNDLYVGGEFNMIGGVTAHNIAKWNTPTVNVKEISSANKISFFPNPTTTTLTIQTPQKTTIEITNIEDKIIKTFNITNAETTIDVSGLSGGVYIIKALSEKGIEIQKFIKQ